MRHYASFCTLRGIYLLQYITCYYGSLCTPWQKSKFLLLVGIRTPSRWAWWRNALCTFRQFSGVLVPKFPLPIYTKQMLPVPTTLLPDDDRDRPWAAHSMTMYWWRKASLLLCTFLLSSNTVCILILWDVRTYISWMPSEWGFSWLYFQGLIWSKDMWPVWVTTVAITQQPEKYDKYLPSDLYRYCHVRETLLTPSR